MDHILALNTAEGVLQFALVRLDESGPVTLTAQSWHAPSQGAELLAPAIESALHRLRLAPDQLGRICVVRGPGSFTGLRLAIATASGLCRATGALSAGLEYLPLLAYSAALRLCREQAGDHTAYPETPCSSSLAARSASTDTPGSPSAPPPALWVLTHARRGLVHAQGFALRQGECGTDDHAPQPLTDIVVCSPEHAMQLLHEHTPAACTPLLLGSGVVKNRESLLACLASPTHSAPSAPAPRLLPDAFAHPDHEALTSLAIRAQYAAKDIEPLYVRASDAEENLGTIAQALHLDPQAAVQRMEELLHHIPENPAE